MLQQSEDQSFVQKKKNEHTEMKRKWNEHSAAWVIQVTEKISGYSFFLQLIGKKKNSEWYERSISDKDAIINQFKMKITIGSKKEIAILETHVNLTKKGKQNKS